MPKLLYARPPADTEEERKIRKLAGSRHAPGDWIIRAKMIVASWDGERTSTIAAGLGCHMQT
ncbi:transposase, partial [Protofrankia coriariae]